MNSQTALGLAQQVLSTIRMLAVGAGVPFADVIGAVADLVIREVGAEVMAQKIDGWKIAEAQADALATVKFGPKK